MHHQWKFGRRLGGGGISSGSYSSSSLSITNCTIRGNSAGKWGGGGIFCWDSSSLSITNCTISGNSAGEGGSGGIFCDYFSPSITNCILWNDSPNEISEYGTPIVTYTDIQGGYTGESNINADPQFVNPAGGDYHLQSGSPCINAGKSGIGIPTDDQDGKPRDGRPDMGAYEFRVANLIELDQFSAASQRDQIIIAWTTLSEIDSAGFNLWRSESGNGKYIRINPGTIEAAGGATLSAGYSYADNTARPGITYYYKLEDIDNSGVSTFHGPISAIISALPPAPNYSLSS